MLLPMPGKAERIMQTATDAYIIAATPLQSILCMRSIRIKYFVKKGACTSGWCGRDMRRTNCRKSNLNGLHLAMCLRSVHGRPLRSTRQTHTPFHHHHSSDNPIPHKPARRRLYQITYIRPNSNCRCTCCTGSQSYVAQCQPDTGQQDQCRERGTTSFRRCVTTQNHHSD